MHPAFILPVILAQGVASAPPQTQPLPILEWRGQYQGDSSIGAEAILNDAHWNRVWRGLEGSGPPLDFTRMIAVVAYAGERPTGGFTLEFLAPVSQGDDLLIQWRVKAPAPDSYTTQAIAHPWKVKAFPRPKGQVKLVRLPDA